MKFHQLPIGATFEFQGKRYSKSGPMTVVESETAKSKMMMRAAAVKPLEGDTEAEAPIQSATVELSRERASIAVNDYHAECLQIICRNEAARPDSHRATGRGQNEDYEEAGTSLDIGLNIVGGPPRPDCCS
ncbi:hypothetical protein [Solemya velesiana gill symbiont]|uniref:Uncharacterized protein n=1 Tax=Solemya velesiana gill symbiont TaxID=1918948 RepID=A0A1T2KXX0_9GAMM|nr:hypothetical protein [Solemya velesiana gill symbiont]OOZ37654.1 hypothetical protein BOW51_01330 [Solemya velesiana gill symbiont]